MTRDDIIRMAQKAGKTQSGVEYTMPFEVLERFAELIAAAEREECEKLCDAIAISARKKYKETYNPYEDGRADGAWECEEAIRARGQE